MGDSSDDEFAMAIAAAAYAFTTTVEEFSPKQKRALKGSQSSLSTAKNKLDDTAIKTEVTSGYFQEYSSDEAKDDRKSEVLDDNFMKRATESHMLEGFAQHKNTEKAIDDQPTIKKTVTFTDKYRTDTDVKRIERGEESRRELAILSTRKLNTSMSGKNSKGMKSGKNSKGIKSVEADAWEQEEIAKIKKSYEKRNTAILEWENEKKTKAKSQMEQQERGLEQRQSKAMQEYRDEIAWIEKLISQTKTLADERKRNEESRVKEQAQLMRSRRKASHSCFCF